MRWNSRIGCRIPDIDIDAVDNSAKRAGARTQQSVETKTVRWRLDFLGVGGRDSRDAIGKLQTRFEKADVAIILDAVDRVGLFWQPQYFEETRGKDSLEREIMDGEHGSRPLPSGIIEISDGESGLPIMGVND